MARTQQLLWPTEVTTTQARNLRRLIEVLNIMTGREGCFPFRRTIAERMGCSTGTVDRALALADDLGVIERQSRITPAGQSSNFYVILWERVRQFCRTDPIEGLLPVTDQTQWQLLNAADFTSPPWCSLPERAAPPPHLEEPPHQDDEPPPHLEEPPHQDDEPYSKELSPELSPDPIPEEGEATAVRSAPPYGQILSQWNLAMCQRCIWTNARRKQLKARWKDPWWRENWMEGVARARASPFLAGDNDRGWRADLEFFLRPDSLTKILEGKFDDRPRTTAAARVGPGQHYAGTTDW